MSDALPIAEMTPTTEEASSISQTTHDNWFQKNLQALNQKLFPSALKRAEEPTVPEMMLFSLPNLNYHVDNLRATVDAYGGFDRFFANFQYLIEDLVYFPNARDIDYLSTRIGADEGVMVLALTLTSLAALGYIEKNTGIIETTMKKIMHKEKGERTKPSLPRRSIPVPKP